MAVKKRSTKSVNNKIQKAIKSINNRHRKLSIDLWRLAKELYELDINIPWRATKYITFNQFCIEETTLGVSAQNRYRAGYKHVLRVGYTMKELEKLSVEFGFDRVAAICAKLTKKVSVTIFIKKYKNFQHGVSVIGNRNQVIMNNSFTFILDDIHAEALTAKLQEYGLVITAKQTKRGLSAAMASWLDSL